MFSSKKYPHTPGCMLIHVIGVLLLLAGTVASALGVYKAHVLADGLVFGTSTGSLAIIAMGLSVTLLLKQIKACMTKCEVCK